MYAYKVISRLRFMFAAQAFLERNGKLISMKVSERIIKDAVIQERKPWKSGGVEGSHECPKEKESIAGSEEAIKTTREMLPTK